MPMKQIQLINRDLFGPTPVLGVTPSGIHYSYTSKNNSTRPMAPSPWTLATSSCVKNVRAVCKVKFVNSLEWLAPLLPAYYVESESLASSTRSANVWVWLMHGAVWVRIRILNVFMCYKPFLSNQFHSRKKVEPIIKPVALERLEIPR